MEKPNILLIFTDQWRGDFLGNLGHLAKTPFVDQLAGEGMTFTSAYCASPSCIPARVCLLTGKTPISNHRIGYMDGVPWNYENNMIDCLNEGGYQTINVGKTHFYPRRNSCGFQINRLYDPQNWLDGKLSDYHQWLYDETDGNVKDTADMVDNNGFAYIPWTADNYLHPTEWTANEALIQLKNRDNNKPFFLQLGFHRPHPPLDPPEEYFNMYRDITFDKAKMGDWETSEAKMFNSHNSPMIGVKKESDRQDALRAYCGMLTHIDHMIGRILFYLSKHAPNTVVIFTSDHGDLLGDHGAWRKIYPYEGSAKIPMIIKDPKNAQVTINRPHDFKRNDTVITHMDIMPTVLSLANLPIPSEVEGIDFTPVLRGEPTLKREYIHGEHSAGDFMSVQFITDGKYKYCYDAYNGTEVFFDLVNDPNELHNAINDEKTSDIANKFKQWLIDELTNRFDGLVINGQLQSGVMVSPIRSELLEDINLKDCHPNARKSIAQLKKDGIL